MATTPSVRIAPVATVQAASSSVYLTLHHLENVVEQVEARLKRLEHSHSSLRRRIVKRDAAQ
jgi:hypothetical protein